MNMLGRNNLKFKFKFAIRPKNRNIGTDEQQNQDTGDNEETAERTQSTNVNDEQASKDVNAEAERSQSSNDNDDQTWEDDDAEAKKIKALAKKIRRGGRKKRIAKRKSDKEEKTSRKKTKVNKGKGKKVEQEENVSGDEDGFKKLYHRNTPKNLYQATRLLLGDRKNVVEGIGFGKMLGMQFDELPRKLAFFCLKSYNPDTNCFELPIGNIEITPEIVHELYGIPIGGEKVEDRVRAQIGGEMNVWWRSRYPKGNISKKKVLDKLKKNQRI